MVQALSHVYLGLFMLFILLGGWAFTASALEPHLVFTKGLPTGPPADSLVYTVHKGDCLYSILKSFQIPRNKLEAWTEKIVDFNPHIRNPDMLYPGDRIYLPAHLAQDLQIPAPLLEAGAKPGQRDKIQPADSGPPSSSPPLKDIQPSVHAPWTDGPDSLSRPAKEKAARNTSLAIKQLGHLGLDFRRSGETIYPLGRGQWARLNLDRTPMASTPWGEKVLFVPRVRASAPSIQDLAQSGLTLCPLPSSWTPNQLYSALEDACRSAFMVWSSSSPLILSLPGEGSLEISAPTILGVKEGAGFRFAVFAPAAARPEHIPGLLLGYLQEHNVQLLWTLPGAKPPAWALKAAPSRRTLFVPSLSRADLGSTTPDSGNEPSDPDIRFSPAQQVNSSLPLDQETVSLSWTAADLHLILRVSVLSRHQQGQTTYFLPGHRADPYLVALLNLMGYSTYELQF